MSLSTFINIYIRNSFDICCLSVILCCELQNSIKKCAKSFFLFFQNIFILIRVFELFQHHRHVSFFLIPLLVNMDNKAKNNTPY